MNSKTNARPRVAVATLGCKANQYESGRMAADFAARGYDIVAESEPADILVINTCTVTNVADSKSRRQIRRMKRLNPQALVVATGCAAEIDPAGIAAAAGIDLVVPNRAKASLVGNAIALGARRGYPLPTLSEDATPANAASCRLPSLGRTRALLMVQDGCGYKCSYCIIPTARPVRVSRPFDAIIEEAEALAADGYREIVLTGISIGSWREGQRRLHHLVRRLAEVSGLAHIRMSSIEPKTVSAPLIDAFAELPQCCRHFHIPLQAGEDATLKAMNRYYDTATFARLIERIRQRMPDAGISTDVITGFPTETDEQFERTVRFCEEMDFAKIHVFPFSPRAGTPAAALRDEVGPERRKERTARLIALSDDGARWWADRHVGEVVDVIAEPRDPATGLYSGLSGAYVRVHWPSDAELHGQVVRVRIESARDGAGYGVAI
ncbi:MAG TPA: tRNA (N(6)-L-threonylcarbamoyladenosine(37)-C(2))-methylthiotransferase MtaB [Armatimonadota bacterium]|jgi:threonylcarbamoyladenosine tRNA methylthiotransferase MtaB